MEQVNLIFFIIVKNLENMGATFFLWSIFMFLFWLGINHAAYVCEQILHIENIPRWYDLLIMSAFIVAWIYGIYNYGKYIIN